MEHPIESLDLGEPRADSPAMDPADSSDHDARPIRCGLSSRPGPLTDGDRAAARAVAAMLPLRTDEQLEERELATAEN